MRNTRVNYKQMEGPRLDDIIEENTLEDKNIHDGFDNSTVITDVTKSTRCSTNQSLIEIKKRTRVT